MPISPTLLGILFALSSALIWGSGDFSGGYASRRSSQYQVLALSALSGLVILAAAAILSLEDFPSSRSILFSILAGVSGALGISALYRGLSIGPAALVAPTAAVIGASLPVIISGLFEGWPTTITLLGFGLAFAGIWILSTASGGLEGEYSHSGFVLACLAGAGFAGFFTLLGLVEPGKLFTPLIVARVFTLGTSLLLIHASRQPLPALSSNPAALLAGVLDAGGNLFYIMAKQYVRLDTAVVLASLYPASTVILAGMIFKETLSRKQLLGLLICLAAVALISREAS